MRAALPLLPLLLAGCASLSTPLPKEVRLAPERLTVTLTDGEQCLGARTAANATPTGWQGTLAGCSQALPYQVRIDPHHNLLQGLLTEILGAIGAQGVLAPNGSVEITDAFGHRHLFVSPPDVRPLH